MMLLLGDKEARDAASSVRTSSGLESSVRASFLSALRFSSHPRSLTRFLHLSTSFAVRRLNRSLINDVGTGCNL